MEHVDLLLHARWVIPVEPPDTVLEHHSVAVRDGRILAILPQAQARAAYRATRVEELADHALLPGLINAHTHSPMSLLRGLADDLPLMQWLSEHIWPAEQAHVSAEFCQDGAELSLAEMLLGGVTCMNDMYFFPDVLARSAARAGMRAAIGMILIDFPSAWASGPEEYLSKGLALHDEYRNHPLISTPFAPHAPYTVSEPWLERVATLAEELQVAVHIHLHETAHEVAESVAQTGERPIARLDRLGLLNPGLMAVHMTQLQDEEIARLAETGSHVVHCPESNLKLASGFCPAQKLLDAGVNLALGTDGAASNNDLDMFGEMRTAALLAKGVSGDATALPAARALHMATLGGARALGLEAQTGSLVAGKTADLIAVDLSGLDMEPVHDPVSQLVYAGNRQQVSHVWVAGRHLVNQRRLTTLDREEILGKCRRWRDKIAGKQ
ncbi:TRZ/ATZ family hydrolase [Alkalilimnicola sp. S0819]|uniref:TRZ/ATZ family hydrolase n=1 Tax=Alkalilimnicola sp. S0819 TaxID=2613922 RepID=UPI0012622EF3|nr:TRZ/ATZ family hydrolase [Alkalilimnicola sp. S0819]KAB7623670.1 TRZ/ATZ family hydrolase [Alkalilimnicola sp. S0819]MPQ16795.1 TRZ/ATZ family hydrolase [Alkalilimnicola sp. S0819]